MSIGNDTLLHIAVRIAHVGLISRLLAAGLPVNASNSQNMAVIHISAINGNMDIFKLLLTHGANLNKRARFDYTALMFAVEYRHFELVEFILKKGADMGIPVGLKNHPIMKVFDEPALDFLWRKVVLFCQQLSHDSC